MKIKENQVYDMCAGEVNINVRELQKALASGIKHTRSKVEAELKRTYSGPPYPKTKEDHYHANHSMQFAAKELREAAAELARLFEAYHAVTEAFHGRELTVKHPDSD